MMGRRFIIFLPLLLLLCCAFGRCTHEPPPKVKLFPPEEVCSYPAKSSVKKLHPLGIQTWQPLSITDADAGFRCGGAPLVVEIFMRQDASVSVEYSAIGSGPGATVIHIDYSASSAAIPIENESTYRQVYVNFLAEIMEMALKRPMPELVRKKILNLHSYSALGSSDEESFLVGDGFINLSRNRKADNTVIEASTRIYSDIALKLE